jgi:hypothetical protein
LLLHPPQGTPQIKLHIYIDDIKTSAVPSDTISVDATIVGDELIKAWRAGSGAVIGRKLIPIIIRSGGFRFDRMFRKGL